MAAIRVVPRWTKGHEHGAAGFQHGMHRVQNGGGVLVVFKRVERDDDVGAGLACVPSLGDRALLRQPRSGHTFGGTGNPPRPRLESDYTPGPMLIASATERVAAAG